MFRNLFKTKGRIDRPFLFTLLALIAIGLLMVFSASMYSSTINGSTGYSQFSKQAFFALIGLGLMYLLSRVNYLRLTKLKNAFIFFGATIFLLFLVWVPGIGVEVNGAHRWVNLGITFQPSEIAKMSGIILISAIITKDPRCVKTPIGFSEKTKWLWICYALILGTCFIILIEPSMSAAMAVGLGMFAVLFYGGIRLAACWPLVAALGAGFFYFMFTDWRWSRILAFAGKNNTNYQISQSLLAFGSGGIFGVGLGNGKQKLLFLPEIQNDFIFANIGEEFGLIGCIVVLMLYAFLIYRGFQIATHCKNRFGFLYTSSIMTLLGYQIFINIAVATRIFPVTGMALPFISYGGTSIIILLVTVGPILNISRQVNLEARGRRKRTIERDEYTRSSRRNGRSYISGNRNI